LWVADRGRNFIWVVDTVTDVVVNRINHSGRQFFPAQRFMAALTNGTPASSQELMLADQIPPATAAPSRFIMSRPTITDAIRHIGEMATDRQLELHDRPILQPTTCRMNARADLSPSGA
jgi:hypothetical protein